MYVCHPVFQGLVLHVQRLSLLPVTVGGVVFKWEGVALKAGVVGVSVGRNLPAESISVKLYAMLVNGHFVTSSHLPLLSLSIFSPPPPPLSPSPPPPSPPPPPLFSSSSSSPLTFRALSRVWVHSRAAMFVWPRDTGEEVSRSWLAMWEGEWSTELCV